MRGPIHSKIWPARKGKARVRRERGQSLVETAVVFPILLLLVAAVVDFGRAFDAYIVLTNAVREGARYGTLQDPQPPVLDVENIVIVDVLGSGTNITTMDAFGADNVDVLMGSTAVTVTATYDFDLWFGGVIGLPTVTLSKSAVMPMFYSD
ncbi:MAG TPA: TadE family protein [Anaerolineae bacterium]|nr:TadE family protein [Anaerolineae bacterium]